MTAIFANKNLSVMLEIVINVCFARAVVACWWGSYHRQERFLYQAAGPSWVLRVALRVQCWHLIMPFDWA